MIEQFYPRKAVVISFRVLPSAVPELLITAQLSVYYAKFETEDQLIRGGLIRLLYGDARLKMDVTSFPVSEEDLKEQKSLREGFQELGVGKRRLAVSVSRATEGA